MFWANFKREAFPENSNGTCPDWLIRGFTGHEHLRAYALIHMNARLYDPIVSRMLSPDNFVADADATQAYYRYSYCLNNPLKFVDPDGNHPILFAFGIWASVTSNMMAGNVNSFGDLGKAALIGAVASAGSMFVGGVVIGSISIGGFWGGAAVGASAGLTSGFIGSSGNAWLRGASFEEGLITGLKGGGYGLLTGGLIGGVYGGTRVAKFGLDFWKGDRIMSERFRETFQPELLASSDEGFEVGDKLSKFRANFSNDNIHSEVLKAFAKARVYELTGREIKMHELVDFSTLGNAGFKDAGPAGMLYREFSGKNGSATIYLNPRSQNYSVKFWKTETRYMHLYSATGFRDETMLGVRYSNQALRDKFFDDVIKLVRLYNGGR